MEDNAPGDNPAKKDAADRALLTLLVKALYAAGKADGFILPDGKPNKEAVRIGELLNELGGLTAMQSGARITIALLRDKAGLDLARDLEHCWHGIGDWLG